MNHLLSTEGCDQYSLKDQNQFKDAKNIFSQIMKDLYSFELVQEIDDSQQENLYIKSSQEYLRIIASLNKNEKYINDKIISYTISSCDFTSFDFFRGFKNKQSRGMRDTISQVRKFMNMITTMIISIISRLNNILDKFDYTFVEGGSSGRTSEGGSSVRGTSGGGTFVEGSQHEMPQSEPLHQNRNIAFFLDLKDIFHLRHHKINEEKEDPSINIFKYLHNIFSLLRDGDMTNFYECYVKTLSFDNSIPISRSVFLTSMWNCIHNIENEKVRINAFVTAKIKNK